jgi:hypothetical protein
MGSGRKSKVVLSTFDLPPHYWWITAARRTASATIARTPDHPDATTARITNTRAANPRASRSGATDASVTSAFPRRLSPGMLSARHHPVRACVIVFIRPAPKVGRMRRWRFFASWPTAAALPTDVLAVETPRVRRRESRIQRPHSSRDWQSVFQESFEMKLNGLIHVHSWPETCGAWCELPFSGNEKRRYICVTRSFVASP